MKGRESHRNASGHVGRRQRAGRVANSQGPKPQMDRLLVDDKGDASVQMD